MIRLFQRKTPQIPLSISGLENGAKFKPGEDIKVNLTFSDNVELDSWKIKINSINEDEKAWESEISGNISGKKIQLDEIIRIPDDAKAGKYQFVVSVTDKAGNTEQNTMDIEILNKDGYNNDGFNKNGYNRKGFNKAGFDIDGFDKNGYDREGYNKTGFNKDGIDREGYNRKGFDKNGYPKDKG